MWFRCRQPPCRNSHLCLQRLKLHRSFTSIPRANTRQPQSCSATWNPYEGVIQLAITYASHVPVEKCFALYSPSFPISLPTFLAVFVFPSSDFPSFPRETGSRCGTFPINAAVLEISACLQYCSTLAQPVVNNAFNNDNKSFINQYNFWGVFLNLHLLLTFLCFEVDESQQQV